MRDWLVGMEDEFGIQILFACEAGSRAWGIQTDESDFDIRFIYRYRNVRKYLSLRKIPDVLEFQSPIDVTGFDLFKVCDLILKSNPSIYEWAFSPHVYMESNQFSNQLKQFISTNYSPFSLYKHYSSVKKQNVKELVKGEFNFKKQKQLIQAVRADLICRGLIKSKSIFSPYDYIDNVLNQSGIGDAYQTLTEAKRKQILLTNTEINEMIRFLSVAVLNESMVLPKIQPNLDQLEHWLWDLLDI